MHFHLSFMEPRKGLPYWRMIADLNPSIEVPEDTAKFAQAIKEVEHMSPALYSDAREFGDKYFWIPALQRHRGVRAEDGYLIVVQLERTH